MHAEDTLPDSLSYTDIRSLVHDLHKKITNCKTLNVIYFLDKEFCYRCVAGEITSGWIAAPPVVSSHIGLYSVVFDKLTGVHKKLEKPLPERFKPLSSGVPERLTALTESAVLTDSSGNLLFWYPIGKTSFQKAYSIADSILATMHAKRIDSSTLAQKTIRFSSDIHHVTYANITPNRIQFFSSKSLESWLCNSSNGTTVRHDTLYTSPGKCIDLKIPIKEYDQIHYLSDSTALVKYTYHHSPVDTILFNEEGLYYRKNSQRIDALRGNNLEVIVDSLQADHVSAYSELLVLSLTLPTIGWRTSFKTYDDTSSTFVMRRTINCRQTDSLVLPKNLCPVSEKHCVAYDSTLWWLSSSRHFHRLSSPKNLLSGILSYPLHPQIAYTYTDGETLSVVSDNGLERTLVGYSRIGIRTTPVISIPQGSIGYISKNSCYILRLNPETLQWELRMYSLLNT